MNVQILPNWCKKLGLLLFILGGLPSFYEGLNSGLNVSYEEIYNKHSYLWYSDIVGYLGILMYFLSREKVEDDYINKLRLESYQITSIIGVGITFILFLLIKDLKVHVSIFF